MTHLHRIFVRRASVPVCFSKIFPVSSTMCVSHYNLVPLVFGNHLCLSSAVSSPGTKRPMRGKMWKKGVEDFDAVEYAKAMEDITKWKLKGAQSQSLSSINTIGGIMITPQSYGWVLFDVASRTILDYRGELIPLMFMQKKLAESLFDAISRDIKKNIPDCDLYIMEAPKYYAGCRAKSTIECMLTRKLVHLLNPGCDSPESLPGKVIIQDKKKMDSMFGLRIKTERVSAYQTVMRMVAQSDNTRRTEEKLVFNVLSTKNVKLSRQFVTEPESECELVMETISLAFLLVFSHFESILPEIIKQRKHICTIIRTM